jgi:hypothetical protein
VSCLAGSSWYHVAFLADKTNGTGGSVLTCNEWIVKRPDNGRQRQARLRRAFNTLEDCYQYHNVTLFIILIATQPMEIFDTFQVLKDYPMHSWHCFANGDVSLDHKEGFEEVGRLVDDSLRGESFLDRKSRRSNHGQTSVLDFSQLNTLLAGLVLRVEAQRVESEVCLKESDRE